MLVLESIFWMSCFIIAYHMFVHPIILTTISAKTVTQIAPNDHEPLPSVDVIIPIYNEQTHIARKLDNLLKLDYPTDKLNVYLGLDGCTDHTASVIRSMLTTSAYSQCNIQVRTYPNNRGKIAVLNELVAESSSEIILFTDASALLPEDAIQILIRRLAKENVGAVSAAYQLVQAGQQGESAYWKYQSKIKIAESQLGSVLGAHGSGYAIKRALYEPLEAHIINDDFVIPMQIIRKGSQVKYSPEVIALEVEGSTTTQDFNRRKRLALGNIQQVIECIDLIHPKYGWTAFNFLAGKVTRAFFPVLLLLIFITTTILATSHIFYLAIFTLQLLFYGLTVMGLMLNKQPSKRFIYLFFYLIAGYLASMVGCWKFISGHARYTWQKK